MRRRLVIDTPEQLRAVSDPLRIRLIMMLLTEEATGKQLADRLCMSASKVHYHLRELEQQGLVEVVRNEEKNGILQKFYRAAALDYSLSEDLLPSLRNEGPLVQEILVGQLRIAVSRVYEAPDESFESDGGCLEPTVLSGLHEVRATKDEIREWLRRHRELVAELLALDRARREEPVREESGGADGGRGVFFLAHVGFFTDTEYFRAGGESSRTDGGDGANGSG